MSNLRAATTRPQGKHEIATIVGELSVKSPEFARLWAHHDVGERRRGVKRLEHPVVGPLDLQFEVLILSDPGEQRLVTYLPADETSADALAVAIAQSPRPALRVVDRGA